MSIWLHPEDLAKLIRIGLEHPTIQDEVFYGMAGNARAWWDTSNALKFGYKLSMTAKRISLMCR